LAGGAIDPERMVNLAFHTCEEPFEETKMIEVEALHFQQAMVL
jgi:hypothetical protein